MNDYLVNKEDLDMIANAINKLDRNYERLNFPEDYIAKLEDISNYVQNLSLTVNGVGCEVSKYTPTVMKLSTVFLTVKAQDKHFFKAPYEDHVTIKNAEFTVSYEEPGTLYITISNIIDDVTVDIKALKKFTFHYDFGYGIYTDIEYGPPRSSANIIYEGEDSETIRYKCDPGVKISNIKATNGRVIWTDSYFYVTDVVGDVYVSISSNVHLGSYNPGNYILSLVGQSSQPPIHRIEFMHESDLDLDASVEDLAPDYYINGWLYWFKEYTGMYTLSDTAEINIHVDPTKDSRYYYPERTFEVVDVVVSTQHTVKVFADVTVTGCDYEYILEYPTVYWTGAYGNDPGQYYYRDEKYSYEDPITGETLEGSIREYIGIVGSVNPNQYGLKANVSRLKLYNFNTVNGNFHIKFTKHVS